MSISASSLPATAPASSRDRDRTIALTILAFAVLLGLALRVYGLDRESIWNDEAMSIRVSSGSLAAITAFNVQDVHPPLYYYLLHVWMRLFGSSVAAVRLLSAVLGVLTVPLIYLTGARLFDRGTGLVAALFLATATFHVAYGQEARMYSLLALLSLLSLDASYRLLAGPREEGSPQPQGAQSARRTSGTAGLVVMCGVSTALMLYTHVYGGFVVAAELASAALLVVFDRARLRRVWKPFVLAQALAFVLFLPWLFVLFGQVAQVQQDYWIQRLGLIGIWSTLSMFCGSWALSKTLRVLALLGGVVCLLGYPRGNRLTRWTAVTVLLWIGGPLVLPWIVSQVSRPIFLTRCTIAASLAFYLLAARGLTLLPTRALRVAVVAGILALNAVPLHGYFTVLAKTQWREAAARIGTIAQPGDLLLFDRPYGQMPFDYYLTRRDLHEVPCLQVVPETFPLDEAARRIDRLIEGRARVWLVVSSPDRIVPVALDRLGRHGRLERKEEWGGVEAYLFASR